MGVFSLLFSVRGRINRLQYWLGNLGVGVLALVGIGFALMSGASAVASKTPESILAGLGGFIVIFVPVMALAYWCGTAIQIKRLHDRGRSWLLTLLPYPFLFMMMTTVMGAAAMQVPAAELALKVQPYLVIIQLINLFFFVDLGCLPGTDGPNKYDGDTPFVAPPSQGKSPSKGPAPANAASAIFGAQAAMERAIAERTSAPHLRKPAVVTPPATPVEAAQTQVRAPAPRTAPKPASFGRRVTQ